jgi:hypothetical protein
MSIFNRKAIALESIANMKKYKGQCHFHIADDGSNEFSPSDVISEGDSSYVNSVNQGIDQLRIRQLYHFLQSDFDFCYFTDSDTLHDPKFVERLFEIYDKTQCACSLFNPQESRHHDGFNIDIGNDIIIRPSIPGISMFFDKSIGHRILAYYQEAVRFKPDILKYYGSWDWMFCYALSLVALSRISYLEHLYQGGMHADRPDRALNPTSWLIQERQIVLDRLEL